MIPKSLREKKRYILCRLIKFNAKNKQPDFKQNEENINKEIRIVFQKNVFSLYGDVGASKMQGKIIEVKKEKEDIFFIVMCNYQYVGHVEFALANIKELNNQKITVNIIQISGTQKKLKQYLKVKGQE